MAFLKQLRATHTESARSADVELWSPRGQGVDAAYEGQRQHMRDEAKAELEQYGEAVDVVAYGLPLVREKWHDRRDNPERKHEWRIEQKDWLETSTLPLRLPIEDSGLDESRHAVWEFEGKVFLAEDPDLTPEDVRALLRCGSVMAADASSAQARRTWNSITSSRSRWVDQTPPAISNCSVGIATDARA